jgi:hypothetical protein
MTARSSAAALPEGYAPENVLRLEQLWVVQKPPHTAMLCSTTSYHTNQPVDLSSTCISSTIRMMPGVLGRLSRDQGDHHAWASVAYRASPTHAQEHNQCFLLVNQLA